MNFFLMSWRGVSVGTRGFAAFPAFCEAEAVAVEFENVDMVRQAVRRSEPNTLVYSSKGRLLVMSVLPRS
jgi:hypothetical protein